MEGPRIHFHAIRILVGSSISSAKYCRSLNGRLLNGIVTYCIQDWSRPARNPAIASFREVHASGFWNVLRSGLFSG